MGTDMGGGAAHAAAGWAQKEGLRALVEANGGWAQKEKLGPGWRQRAGGHK